MLRRFTYLPGFQTPPRCVKQGRSPSQKSIRLARMALLGRGPAPKLSSFILISQCLNLLRLLFLTIKRQSLLVLILAD